MKVKDVVDALAKFEPEAEVVVMGPFPRFEYREISGVSAGVRPIGGLTPPSIGVGSIVREKGSE